MKKKEIKKFDINNLIIINIVSFKEKNLKYFFLYFDEKIFENNIKFSLFDILNFKNNSSGNDREIIKWKTSYTREELLFYNKTIYKFCFDIKRWDKYLSLFLI
jgi:hypothetical protein